MKSCLSTPSPTPGSALSAHNLYSLSVLPVVNIIQHTWVCLVLRTGSLFSFILQCVRLSGCLKYGLNALTDKKKKKKRGNCISSIHTLVYLVKSFWVKRVPLTSSSFASFWMQILICKLAQHNLPWAVHKGHKYLISNLVKALIEHW